MNPIVPYENDNPYRRPTIAEAIGFWEYMYKKGLSGIILYFLSFAMLLLIFWWIARGLLSKYILADPWLMLIVALPMFGMLFLYIPAMPRSYESQFKGKMRRDIPESELKGLSLELTGKSLELSAMIIIGICLLCMVVYIAALYLAIPDTITLALEAATVFNTFLISLVAASLGGYNREVLRKTFTEEEYKRYTSPGHYRRTFLILAVFDVLIGVFILYNLWGNLTIEMAMIILIAVLDNVLLASGLWNYRRIKNEYGALAPRMKLSLAMLAMVDLIFIVAPGIQKIWAGASYEKTVFVLLTIFILTAGLLQVLWLVSAPVRRMLKP